MFYSIWARVVMKSLFGLSGRQVWLGWRGAVFTTWVLPWSIITIKILTQRDETILNFHIPIQLGQIHFANWINSFGNLNKLILWSGSNWYSISGCNVQVAVTLLRLHRNKFHSPGQFVCTNPLSPWQDNNEHCRYEEKVSFGYLELLLGSCNRGGNPRPIFDIYVWGDILPSTQDIRALYDCFYYYMLYYKYDTLCKIFFVNQRKLVRLTLLLYRWIIYVYILYTHT